MKPPLFNKTALLLSCLLASCLRVAAAFQLLDFEDPAAATSVSCRVLPDRVACVTNAFATSGGHSLFVKFAPWRDGMDQWPSLNLMPKEADWTKYDRLVMDIVSVGEGLDSLSTFICGADGPVQNGLHAKTPLPARGYFQWVVPLANWPTNCTPANIGRIHLFTTTPRDLQVFIDNVALLEKGEPLPHPAGGRFIDDLAALVRQVSAEKALLAADAVDMRRHVKAYFKFRDACRRDGQDVSEMCVGVASPMTHVRPRDCEIPAIPAKAVSLRLARNEHESVQLVVAPGNEDLHNVKVAATNLKSGDGAVFSATNIECDVMGFVRTTSSPPYDVAAWAPAEQGDGMVKTTTRPKTGWWPDPILDFLDGVDIVDQDAQPFWIRVHCPSSQAAGVYSGSLVVAADGVSERRIPFKVRVNKFAVPVASPLPLAITFSPGDHAATAGAAPDYPASSPDAAKKAWAKHETEWGDFLADYYITMDSLYHNGAIHWDVLTRLKRQGRLGYFNLGYWNAFDESTEKGRRWKDGKLRQLHEAYDKAKELGLLDHAYIYGCDEAPADKFPAIAKTVSVLKREFPGVPVFTTAYDGNYGVDSPLSEIDWFTPTTPKFEKARAETARRAGHKVWWYIACNPRAPHANMFVECPPIEGRLLMGAQAVRMNPDGFLYYQVSIWNSLVITNGPYTSWNPRSWTTYHGDGSWTCAGPDGKPLPTIRLENFRDGLEDYAYAKLLAKKLKAGGKSPEWTARAKALLAVPPSVMKSMTDFTGDPADVMRWRNAMADLIDER